MKLARWLAAVLCLLVLFVFSVYQFLPLFLEQSMNVVKQKNYPEVSGEAKTLHAQWVIADLHADPLLWNRDLLSRSGTGHVDVPRLQAGGVGLQVLSTVTKSPRGMNYTQNDADAIDNITLLAVVQAWPVNSWQSLLERALYQAEKLHGFIADSGGDVVLLESQADFYRWQDQRQRGLDVLATVLATEGSHALEGELKNIDRLFDAGFRMMSLQHFFDNQLGGSLHGQHKQGLTDFGRQVVLGIVDKGIMLDLSHSSEQVVRDVLAITDAPVLISHTGFKGHCDSPRNISDDLMVAIAQRGGVIGVGFWEAAVCGTAPSDIAAAIVYGVGLVGEDHVALGSDFDGAVTTGFDSSELVLLTQALLDAGMDRVVIEKVMGVNVLQFIAAGLPSA